MSNILTYNGKTYTDTETGGDRLMSASCYLGDSLTGDTLAVDTLTVVVRDYDLEARFLAASGQLLVDSAGRVLMSNRANNSLLQYQYATEMYYYHDDVLIGKFYLESITRQGKYEYKLEAVSAIGLLLTDYHYGGIYTGETVETVIKDIVHGAFTYTVNSTISSTKLYGYLPKGTRRDNLRDVLFAVGGAVQKYSTTGNIVFAGRYKWRSYSINANNIYLGGDVANGNPASEVRITEHAYHALATDELVTLFDGEADAETLTTPNGATVSGVLVEFSDPMHDLSIQNGTILESGVNYAVLAQSAKATLTGRKYTHTTRIVSRTGTAGATPNVVTSDACALVNPLNSERVADRVMAYYGSAKAVSMDVVMPKYHFTSNAINGSDFYATLIPGDYATFTDPFGDKTSGYIESIDITMSNKLKGRATIISDFTPAGYGNYYTGYRIFGGNTSGTTWTVPSSCKGQIRVILVGGGQGGWSGGDGAAGGTGEAQDSKGSFDNALGEGGAGGSVSSVAPTGGKVAIFTIPVSPGDTFTLKCGTGGAGGKSLCTQAGKTGNDSTEATAPQPGEYGTATTFGDYSSDSGTVSEVGVDNIFTGITYGLPGYAKSVPGGKGGKGWNGSQVVYAGEDVSFGVSTWKGAWSSRWFEVMQDGAVRGALYAGGGGGAAYGNNGGNTPECFDQSHYESGYLPPGGKGADAQKYSVAITKTDYGRGGTNGMGGGGGGGGGLSGSSLNDDYAKITPGPGGLGGLGGAGQDGASGIVIIYY